MALAEKYMPRCRIFLLDGAKFRTNLLVLFFDLPLRRDTATKTALLAEVLKRRNWQEAAKQAEELYGAIWDVSVVKKGDRQLLLFSLETLKMVEMDQALDFLRGRIFGDFDEKTVSRQKEILQKKLRALQDNKRAFARKRVSEETAEGTAYGISGDGYGEDIEEISSRVLSDWYRNILEKGEVKVFFCGDQAEKQKILSLRQDFSGRVAVLEKNLQEQPKHGPRFLREVAEMEQARLCMGFLAETENSRRQAASAVLNHLLGGSPDSLLFRKVREEKGLCYDISSEVESMGPYLFVQAGIREEDAKEAGRLVLQCIERFKKEEISREKLEQAKENLLRKCDAICDSPWAMIDFMSEQVLQGNPLTTEKVLHYIAQADEEEIQRAARHLELQVVYLLGGKVGSCYGE